MKPSKISKLILSLSLPISLALLAVGFNPPASKAAAAAMSCERVTTGFFDGIQHSPARSLAHEMKAQMLAESDARIARIREANLHLGDPARSADAFVEHFILGAGNGAADFVSSVLKQGKDFPHVMVSDTEHFGLFGQYGDLLRSWGNEENNGNRRVSSLIQSRDFNVQGQAHPMMNVVGDNNIALAKANGSPVLFKQRVTAIEEATGVRPGNAKFKVTMEAEDGTKTTMYTNAVYDARGRGQNIPGTRNDDTLKLIAAEQKKFEESVQATGKVYLPNVMDGVLFGRVVEKAALSGSDFATLGLAEQAARGSSHNKVTVSLVNGSITGGAAEALRALGRDVPREFYPHGFPKDSVDFVWYGTNMKASVLGDKAAAAASATEWVEKYGWASFRKEMTDAIKEGKIRFGETPADARFESVEVLSDGTVKAKFLGADGKEYFSRNSDHLVTAFGQRAPSDNIIKIGGEDGVKFAPMRADGQVVGMQAEGLPIYKIGERGVAPDMVPGYGKVALNAPFIDAQAAMIADHLPPAKGIVNLEARPGGPLQYGELKLPSQGPPGVKSGAELLDLKTSLTQQLHLMKVDNGTEIAMHIGPDGKVAYAGLSAKSAERLTESFSHNDRLLESVKGYMARHPEGLSMDFPIQGSHVNPEGVAIASRSLADFSADVKSGARLSAADGREFGKGIKESSFVRVGSVETLDGWKVSQKVKDALLNPKVAEAQRAALHRELNSPVGFIPGRGYQVGVYGPEASELRKLYSVDGPTGKKIVKGDGDILFATMHRADADGRNGLFHGTSVGEDVKGKMFDRETSKEELGQLFHQIIPHREGGSLNLVNHKEPWGGITEPSAFVGLTENPHIGADQGAAQWGHNGVVLAVSAPAVDTDILRGRVPHEIGTGFRDPHNMGEHEFVAKLTDQNVVGAFLTVEGRDGNPRVDWSSFKPNPLYKDPNIARLSAADADENRAARHLKDWKLPEEAKNVVVLDITGDPPHLAHLQVAKDTIAQLKSEGKFTDKDVLLLVVNDSGQKPDASAHALRRAMAENLFSEIPQARFIGESSVGDFSRSKQYTEIIQAISGQPENQGKKIFSVSGADVVKAPYYQSEKKFGAELVVTNRDGAGKTAIAAALEEKGIKEPFTFVQSTASAEVRDLSSTQVRQLVREAQKASGEEAAAKWEKIAEVVGENNAKFIKENQGVLFKSEKVLERDNPGALQAALDKIAQDTGGNARLSKAESRDSQTLAKLAERMRNREEFSKVSTTDVIAAFEKEANPGKSYDVMENIKRGLVGPDGKGDQAVRAFERADPKSIPAVVARQEKEIKDLQKLANLVEDTVHTNNGRQFETIAKELRVEAERIKYQVEMYSPARLSAADVKNAESASADLLNKAALRRAANEGILGAVAQLDRANAEVASARKEIATADKQRAILSDWKKGMNREFADRKREIQDSLDRAHSNGGSRAEIDGLHRRMDAVISDQRRFQSAIEKAESDFEAAYSKKAAASGEVKRQEERLNLMRMARDNLVAEEKQHFNALADSIRSASEDERLAIAQRQIAEGGLTIVVGDVHLGSPGFEAANARNLKAVEGFMREHSDSAVLSLGDNFDARKIQEVIRARGLSQKPLESAAVAGEMQAAFVKRQLRAAGLDSKTLREKFISQGITDEAAIKANSKAEQAKYVWQQGNHDVDGKIVGSAVKIDPERQRIFEETMRKGLKDETGIQLSYGYENTIGVKVGEREVSTRMGHLEISTPGNHEVADAQLAQMKRDWQRPPQVNQADRGNVITGDMHVKIYGQAGDGTVTISNPALTPYGKGGGGFTVIDRNGVPWFHSIDSEGKVKLLVGDEHILQPVGKSEQIVASISRESDMMKVPSQMSEAANRNPLATSAAARTTRAREIRDNWLAGDMARNLGVEASSAKVGSGSTTYRDLVKQLGAVTDSTFRATGTLEEKAKMIDSGFDKAVTGIKGVDSKELAEIKDAYRKTCLSGYCLNAKDIEAVKAGEGTVRLSAADVKNAGEAGESVLGSARMKNALQRGIPGVMDELDRAYAAAKTGRRDLSTASADLEKFQRDMLPLLDEKIGNLEKMEKDLRRGGDSQAREVVAGQLEHSRNERDQVKRAIEQTHRDIDAAISRANDARVEAKGLEEHFDWMKAAKANLAREEAKSFNALADSIRAASEEERFAIAQRHLAEGGITMVVGDLHLGGPGFERVNARNLKAFEGYLREHPDSAIISLGDNFDARKIQEVIKARGLGEKPLESAAVAGEMQAAFVMRQLRAAGLDSKTLREKFIAQGISDEAAIRANIKAEQAKYFWQQGNHDLDGKILGSAVKIDPERQRVFEEAMRKGLKDESGVQLSFGYENTNVLKVGEREVSTRMGHLEISNPGNHGVADAQVAKMKLEGQRPPQVNQFEKSENVITGDMHIKVYGQAEDGTISISNPAMTPYGKGGGGFTVIDRYGVPWFHSIDAEGKVKLLVGDEHILQPVSKSEQVVAAISRDSEVMKASSQLSEEANRNPLATSVRAGPTRARELRDSWMAGDISKSLGVESGRANIGKSSTTYQDLVKQLDSVTDSTFRATGTLEEKAKMIDSGFDRAVAGIKGVDAKELAEIKDAYRKTCLSGYCLNAKDIEAVQAGEAKVRLSAADLNSPAKAKISLQDLWVAQDEARFARDTAVQTARRAETRIEAEAAYALAKNRYERAVESVRAKFKGEADALIPGGGTGKAWAEDLRTPEIAKARLADLASRREKALAVANKEGWGPSSTATVDYRYWQNRYVEAERGALLRGWRDALPNAPRTGQDAARYSQAEVKPAMTVRGAPIYDAAGMQRLWTVNPEKAVAIEYRQSAMQSLAEARAKFFAGDASLADMRKAEEAQQITTPVTATDEKLARVGFLKQEADYRAEVAAQAGVAWKAAAAEDKSALKEAYRNAVNQYVKASGEWSGAAAEARAEISSPKANALARQQSIENLTRAVEARASADGRTLADVFANSSEREAFVAKLNRDLTETARTSRTDNGVVEAAIRNNVVTKTLAEASEAERAQRAGKLNQWYRDAQAEFAAVEHSPEPADLAAKLKKKGWSDQEVEACGFCNTRREAPPKADGLSPEAQKTLLSQNASSPEIGKVVGHAPVFGKDSVAEHLSQLRARQANLEAEANRAAKAFEAAKDNPKLAENAELTRRARDVNQRQIDALKANEETLNKAREITPAQAKLNDQANEVVKAYLKAKSEQELAGLSESLKGVAKAPEAKREALFRDAMAQTRMTAEERAAVFADIREFSQQQPGAFAKALGNGTTDTDKVLAAIAKTDELRNANLGSHQATQAVMEANKLSKEEAALAQAAGVAKDTARASSERTAAAKAELAAVEKDTHAGASRSPASANKPGELAKAVDPWMNEQKGALRGMLSDAEQKELKAALETAAGRVPAEAQKAMDHLKDLAAKGDKGDFESYEMAFKNAANSKQANWDQAWRDGVRQMLKDSGIDEAAMKEGNPNLFERSVSCLRAI